MSTTITDPISSAAAGEIELTPVLGAQFQLSWQATVLVAWFAALFLLSSHTPLAVDSNTWSHVNAGQAFHDRSPTNEIAHVPLARGMTKPRTSWLFDSFSSFVALRFGVRGMCIATTIISSIAIWLWSWQFTRESRSTVHTLVSAIVLGVVGSAYFSVFDTRVFDGLLLGLLFAIVWPHARTQTDGNEPRLCSVHFISCFALFAVWANLSTTFVIGLVALLAIVVGKCISQLASRGARGLVAKKTRSWVWLFQLSAVATLLTPLGLRLWTHLLTSEMDSLLAGVVAGRGLYAPTMQGVVTLLLAGCVLLKLAKQQTWFKVESAVLIALGLCLSIDVSAFYCFVATCLLLLASLAPNDATVSQSPNENQPLRFAGTLFALLFIWCGFALSPVSVPFLGGHLRPAESLHGRGAPWSVVNHLQKRASSRSEGHDNQQSVLPAGTTTTPAAHSSFVFAPAYWSDWLMFTGPQELEYFANRDFELLPRRVQADYQRVFRGENGWDRTLDRYAVTTLVLDREAQARLSASAKRNASWKLVVETPTVLTFERKSFERSGS